MKKIKSIIWPRINVVKLFKFDELSKEVQEELYEKARYENVEYCDWHEGVTDQALEKLEEYGFENSNIAFSGFGSQGDGACFDCGSINIDEYLNKHPEKYPIAKKLFDRYFLPHIYTSTNITNSHYNHEKSRYVHLDCETFDIIAEMQNSVLFRDVISTHELGSFIEDVLCSVETVLEDERHELSCEIYADLEKEYNYLTSDPVLKEKFDWYWYDETGVEISEIEYILPWKTRIKKWLNNKLAKLVNIW